MSTKSSHLNVHKHARIVPLKALARKDIVIRIEMILYTYKALARKEQKLMKSGDHQQMHRKKNSNTSGGKMIASLSGFSMKEKEDRN